MLDNLEAARDHTTLLFIMNGPKSVLHTRTRVHVYAREHAYSTRSMHVHTPRAHGPVFMRCARGVLACTHAWLIEKGSRRREDARCHAKL